ncbi:MAG: hypothetical protein A3I29_03820 [Candidatus Magasanikbacteria bacterium RIFCSPLOWO2_02_FULL_44_11]|uniref:Reverse transcriptase domain-containing protein n=2 Tax=Candidatus Magasanikiibacteriota TaxID=1752731 RepID=A0A1F6NAA7_9BACT|nr:MAG: hypothetical protein A3D53_02210 [Candidatus Magasanikbacteria bacterium RIFCSPHIGHO2_02_FULL_45_10]OGH80852.1 MAG: hypothetical protein A3I29_03820 [Candidatus Magasanikbacteria bacterium RIFCSPLOWO2_02_FULL_44_11]
MVHSIKPISYLRYGDDFIVFGKNRAVVEEWRLMIIDFLLHSLGLAINRKNGIIVPTKAGLYFLGVHIFPTRRRLKKRNWRRVNERLTTHNLGSYFGLVAQHGTSQQRKDFQWLVLNKVSTEK